MKVKQITNVNCTTFGLYINKTQNKMFTKIFDEVTNYKNTYIKYVWKQLNDYAEQDIKFKDAMYIIQNQRKLYGTTVNKEELNQRVSDAYAYMNKIIVKDKIISLLDIRSNFMKLASKKYNIYIPDDVRYNALTDVNSGFEKMLFSRDGQNVTTKSYRDLNSIRSKPMYSKMKTGQISNTKSNGSIKLVEEDDKIYLQFWDCTNAALEPILNKYNEQEDKFNTPSNKCPTHKKLKIKIKYKNNNDLQQQILQDIYKGALKISRIYKKGEWRYFLQVNFEELSPVVQKLNFKNKKVAININTEMVAIVRDDGSQEIIKLTPDTPRTNKDINNIKQYLDNSKRVMNKELYKEDGQIKYKKSQMREFGLSWNYSNGYRKKLNEMRELYRLNTDRRKRNNFKLAKQIVESGNEFILDHNQYKAWQMKLNRMNKKSKDKYDNGVRKANDYADQIQDNAPGMFTARIKQICEQLQLPCIELSTFNSSNYNHFTQQEDLFLQLNERFITFNVYKNNALYNELAIQFVNSFCSVKYNEKIYILQRDLYAASKMLFITQVTETKINKNTGKTYNVKVDKFNQDAYSKWFNEIFYPKHLEYIKQLINKYNLGIDINGLILGNK